MYYVIAPTGSDIQHHGILGQKWGTRNGPPYPLTAGAHSSSEKSAGYQKSIKGSGQEKSTGDVKDSGVEMLIYYVGRMALNAAFKKASQGVANLKEAEQDKRRLDLDVDNKTGLPLKKKEMTRKQDMQHVNPAFKNGKLETSNNCTYCVTAYELRRRGFDVRAGKTNIGLTKEQQALFYKEKTMPSMYAYPRGKNGKTASYREKADAINNTLLDQSGDNTRGTVHIYWKSGGGHVFNYDIYDGKVHYFDCQCGKEYKLLSIMPYVLDANTSDGKDVQSWGYKRTDNLTPDYEYLKKEKVII